MRLRAFALLVFVLLAPAGASFAVCDEASSSPRALTSVKLVMTGFATEAIDDSFRLEGVLAPGAPVDPATTGVSVELSNEFVGVLAAVHVPGGDGWRARTRGAASYSDRDGTHGGITRIKLRPLADGTLAVSIAGRRQPYAVSTFIRPIRVAIGFGAETTGGECGVAFLSYSRCAFQPTSNVLRCTPPPSQRRCGDDADARVRCDALNAAAAQEAYYVSHGEYYGRGCTGLPGFTPSPETICSTVGSSLVFVVTTVGLSSTIVCIYQSPADAGEPNLVCS